MAQDPLAQLKDIHLPAQLETGWPALGIWLVLLLLILGFAFAGYCLYQYKKQRKVQKRMIAQLNNIQLGNTKALNQINQILKLAALHYFPRQHVANLHGKPWLQFLDEQLKDVDKGFIAQSESWLSLYQPSAKPATLELLQQAHTWLVHALPVNAKRLQSGLQSQENKHV